MTATKVGPGFVMSMVKAGDGRTGRAESRLGRMERH
jgi:hypothetical protein